MNNLLKLTNYFFKLASDAGFGSANYWQEADIESIKYDFESFIDGTLDITYQDLSNFFDKLSINYKLCKKNNEPWGLSFDYIKKYVIDFDEATYSQIKNLKSTLECPRPELALDFIESADLDKYISESTTSDDFWKYPPVVYHATSYHNYDDILQDGLQGRCSSRGLSNKSVGTSVFVSANSDAIDAYGDLILEINTKAMKQDGYTPEVGIEPDIEEGEKKQALASMIGIEDYNYDFESGMDYDTYIIYGDIPAKYLSIYKG